MNEHIQTIANKLDIALPDIKCPPVGQTSEEIINTLKIVKKLDPKVLLEIGSAYGGFVYLLSTVLDDRQKRTIITIDPWFQATKYGGKYKDYLEITKKLSQFYSHIGYFHIRGKSEAKRTINDLVAIIKGRPIDFLFIDGAHTYKTVSSDWKNYKKYLTKDGLVAFHDIAGDTGAAKAWQEIIAKEKDKYLSLEFLKEGVPLLPFVKEPTTLGVGYLFKKFKPKN